MILALTEMSGWENLGALGALLGGFILLLKWVLGTLTTKLDLIVASIADLAKSAGALHESIRRDSDAHANLMRELTLQLKSTIVK